MIRYKPDCWISHGPVPRSDEVAALVTFLEPGEPGRPD